MEAKQGFNEWSMLKPSAKIGCLMWKNADCFFFFFFRAWDSQKNLFKPAAHHRIEMVMSCFIN